MKKASIFFLTLIFLVTAGTVVNAQPLKVKLVRADDKHKVDVLVGGKLFTSYQYPQNLEKPFLFSGLCTKWVCNYQRFPY